MEELHVGDRAAVDLLEDLACLRTLDLESVVRAIDRLAVRAAVGAWVVREAHAILVDCGLELHPVRRRSTADQDKLILALAKDDHVADHMARRGHGDEGSP